MMIDAHQHFWHYTTDEFGWIDDAMARIRRDFTPADLAAAMAQTGVQGAIAVQARMSLTETEWLLSLGRSHPLIKGVVGWVPLAEPTLRASLDRFADQPLLKGVRHVVQGQPAGFLDAPDFNAGIREITTRQLAYDILIFANQLEEAVRFVDRHPEQRFILDHIAKPSIAGAPCPVWGKWIRELARRENVACKFSGVVTEIPGFAPWSLATVQPYFDIVLSAFGPRRLMFGSDWPVCLVNSEYARWHHAVAALAGSLSEDERTALLGGNAAAWYRL